MKKETFISKAKAKHGDAYTYDGLPAEFKVQEKVRIICPRHGEFLQAAYSHLNGAGCPKCKAAKIAERNSRTAAEWLGRVREKFGEKISVQLPENFKGTSEVTACCRKHGTFQTTLKKLLHSEHGCAKCAAASVAAVGRNTESSILERLGKIYGEAYTYEHIDFSKYENNQDKVTVTCKKHGTFEKSVKRLLAGQGCPECARELKWKRYRETTNENLREKYAKKFPHMDFSQSDFSNPFSIQAVCDKHGAVETTKIRLNGEVDACPLCAEVKHRKSKDNWLSEFEARHQGKYSYRLVADGFRSNGKIPIVCNNHSLPYTFLQTPSDHRAGHGCPRCRLKGMGKRQTSSAEQELAEFLRNLGAVVGQQVPLTCKGREYLMDIVLPEQNVAIEYNGLFFHSTRFKVSPCFHKTKSEAAAVQGLRLIHIFEDDWKHRRPAVEHLLRYTVGVLPVEMARKMTIGEVADSVAKTFYKTYHIQGASAAAQQVHFGLYKQDKLLGVMSFTRNSSGRKLLNDNCWELVRFASAARIQGGAGKLFKAFLRRYAPKEITSFSWNHLFDGGVYSRLGFTLDKLLPPDYTYVDLKRCRRLHKSGFQRSRLAARFPETFDPKLSERENCEMLGYYRIYDCGKKRWVWRP